MADDHLSELLALDAVVLHDYWESVLDEVRDAAGDVHRIVDLGSGTGTGAIGLAQRFPVAEVIAVDASEQMVALLGTKGVTALLADVDDGWPPITEVDITFASMSLHHLVDPAMTLRELYAATRPGGIVAAAEFPEPLRVLRDDYGDGLEQRVMAALRAGHDMPEFHADWQTVLSSSGFEVVVERTFTVDLPAPVGVDATMYAQLWLSRLRHAADEHLTSADKAALDAAVADDAAYHLHGERTLTIGRRRA